MQEGAEEITETNQKNTDNIDLFYENKNKIVLGNNLINYLFLNYRTL
jgi:hypothetical protein